MFRTLLLAADLREDSVHFKIFLNNNNMSSKGGIPGRSHNKEERVSMKDPQLSSYSPNEVKHLSATEKALVNTGNLSKTLMNSFYLHISVLLIVFKSDSVLKLSSAVMGHIQEIGVSDPSLEEMISKCQELSLNLLDDVSAVRNTYKFHRDPVQKLIPFKGIDDMEKMFKVI